MAVGTQIFLGDYFDNFVNQQINSGKYTSKKEVITKALHLFEQQENNSKDLIDELKAGEKSGMMLNFDRKQELANLHIKYLKNEVQN